MSLQYCRASGPALPTSCALAGRDCSRSWPRSGAPASALRRRLLATAPKATAKAATQGRLTPRIPSSARIGSASSTTPTAKSLGNANRDRALHEPRRTEGDCTPVEVDLIGAVHIGDIAYYQQLNERFKQYDALLYELVARKDGGRSAAAARRMRIRSARCRTGIKDVLELDHQLE